MLYQKANRLAASALNSQRTVPKNTKPHPILRQGTHERHIPLVLQLPMLASRDAVDEIDGASPYGSCRLDGHDCGLGGGAGSVETLSGPEFRPGMVTQAAETSTARC